jgi:hypothetical protein
VDYSNNYSGECVLYGRVGSTGVEFWNPEGDGPRSLGTIDLDDKKH